MCFDINSEGLGYNVLASLTDIVKIFRNYIQSDYGKSSSICG